MAERNSVFTRLLVVLVLFSVGVWSLASSLTVLALSEQHGAVLPDGDGVGGLAQVAALVDQVREETGGNVVVVSSGDILVGTVMSSAFRGVVDIEAMNLIGFDALTLGNHEFDFGIAHMDMLEDLANFPFVSTNLVGVGHLGVVSAVIKQVGDVDVAIFGITNPSLYEVTSAETRRLTVVDTMEIAQEAVDVVRDQVDVVIFVTHQDTSEDFALLQGVEGVDLVVGGHTEGFDGMYLASGSFDPSLPAGVPEVRNPRGVFVKPAGATEEVSRVDLEIENGKVVMARAQNIAVQGFEPDPEVSELLASFEAQLSERLGVVIGTAAVTLDGERGDVRTRETNLGNLITDGLLSSFPEADIAFANGGGIRKTIEAGDITLGDVIEVHPFGNTIVTFDLTGVQVLEALENAVSQVEDVSGRFLQVSGLNYTWNSGRPAGERVMSVEVAGAPLDLGASYTIVTNNFIAAGGDGYEVFTQGQNYYDSQQLDADTLGAYIRGLGTVAPAMEGRIVDLGN
ncbi:MAG: 5'-nucleotidase C-terminal domain-containing protein [Trueperaceae bacterium]|nr:MAG: 5'-nucleotidase C-terminal domain-containing protein [Trueperaceae bacterium]